MQPSQSFGLDAMYELQHVVLQPFPTILTEQVASAAQTAGVGAPVGAADGVVVGAMVIFSQPLLFAAV
jgi:hypothetical protein